MARYISAIPQYFDDGGDPLIAGELWFYESGTNGEDTLLDLFFDANMTIPGPNPAILSGAGRVPNIFFSGIANVILKTSEGVELWQADPVGDSGSTSSFETWSSLLIYGVNDVVQGSDFNLYSSIASGNIDNDPTTTPSEWEGVEFVSKWNTFVTYQTSDIAKGSNGFIYRSLQDNNTGNDPLTEPTWWGGTQATGNPDGSILLTKMVHMTAPNMIGRTTAGVGPQEEITPAQVRANINVEDGATADQTGAEIKTAYEVEPSAFTDAQFTKLAGVETGATADQTGAEIKTAYEVEPNAFTDSQFTKLAGIESLADVTDTANVTAAGAVMDTEVDADIKTLDLPPNTTITTFGADLVDSPDAAAARATLEIPAGGRYTFVETLTASSSATLDFTTDFSSPTCYEILFVFNNVIISNDAANFLVRTSPNGSTFDSDPSHYVTGTTGGNAIIVADTVGSTGGENIQGEMKVYSHQQSILTTVKADIMYIDNTGDQKSSGVNGARESNASVLGVRFLASAGTIESGSISMYLRNVD